jgi:hypothetical protein
MFQEGATEEEEEKTTIFSSYLRINILYLITQIKSVTLFREIIAGYSEHHMNTFGAQSTKCLNVQQVIRIVTTVL